MNRLRILIPLALLLLVVALIIGCDKERIVESTVHDTQYIELPPDTVTLHDTITIHDSVTINKTDTAYVHDTIYQTNTVHDTVITVQVHYDTTVIYDTVVQTSTSTDELQAMGALQYYVDPLVLDFINQEFGLNDGWIYYLSAWQSEVTAGSAGVYDIYGYIDYWAPDWSGYYALEYYYRVSYKGGDPGDVNNWELGEPAASPAHPGGIGTAKTERSAPGELIR